MAFKQTRKWENFYQDMFSNRKMTEIYYEDMVNNPQNEFRKITDMLKIEFCSPKTSLKKQNPERLTDLISNYKEIKKYFFGTEWSCFFED